MHEGQIIRFLRKEKNISQSTLAKSICSVRHISNIEAGRSSISYDLIMKFLHKLGTDVSLMVNNDIQNFGFELFGDFSFMEELFSNWQYEELFKLTETIQNNYFLESYILKKLMYYKAVCIHE